MQARDRDGGRAGREKKKVSSWHGASDMDRMMVVTTSQGEGEAALCGAGPSPLAGLAAGV